MSDFASLMKNISGAIGKAVKKMAELLTVFFSEKENGVYYINGADTLPLPLTPEEETKLLDGSLDDESKKSKLIEHNLRLVVFISKKFENTGVGIEELISIGTVGLMKAINTFCPDKNIKLATYASRCIENEILMYIRKTQNRRLEVSIDEPLNIDGEGNELLLSDILGSEAEEISRPLEELEERTMLKKCVERLRPRERMIIELRFGMRGGAELTQKEVADMLGISQSYISRLEKRIIIKMKEELFEYMT